MIHSRLLNFPVGQMLKSERSIRISTPSNYAKVDVGTAKISAVFDIILVDNEEYNL